MKNEAVSQTNVTEMKRKKRALFIGIIVGLIVGALIMFLGNNSVTSNLKAKVDTIETRA